MLIFSTAVSLNLRSLSISLTLFGVFSLNFFYEFFAMKFLFLTKFFFFHEFIFNKFFPNKHFFQLLFFCFEKVELPACSSTEHSHIAHQIRVVQQAQSSCDVKISNLQSFNVLLDNFLNILDRMNMKCGMYVTQNCRSGHTRGFL